MLLQGYVSRPIRNGFRLSATPVTGEGFYLDHNGTAHGPFASASAALTFGHSLACGIAMRLGDFAKVDANGQGYFITYAEGRNIAMAPDSFSLRVCAEVSQALAA